MREVGGGYSDGHGIASWKACGGVCLVSVSVSVLVVRIWVGVSVSGEIQCG